MPLRRPIRSPLASYQQSNEQLVVVSGALERPGDEGTRNFTHALTKYASSIGLRVIAISASDPVHVRKLLLSAKLMIAIRRSGVKTVIYVPDGSASMGSFLRAAVLRAGAKVRVVLIALWANPRRPLADFVARSFSPNLVLTPSVGMRDYLRRLGLRASFVPMGVDPQRFQPVDGTTKRNLRRKHGLPEDHQFILHVGHLQPLRNLEWLVGLGKAANASVLVVAGTSTGVDPEVRDLLGREGIRLIDSYVPCIEQIYQLADVYTFPVVDERGAISVPLSVLEAMACNLPIVTTRFGGLAQMFGEGDGLVYADEPHAFSKAVRDTLDLPLTAVRTREMVLQYSWDNVFGKILSEAASTGSLAH